MRLKAPGAVPGRVGRCPKCKGTLKFPETTAPAPTTVEDEPGPVGYFLEPGLPSTPSRTHTEPRERTRPIKKRKEEPPVEMRTSGGLLPSLDAPESWWFPSLLYPVRGAETMGFMGILGTAFWILTILIPEYCRTLMSDADSMGATSMGYLVALITSLPAIILIPPTLFYLLQFLGRVLVSSAMGEIIPPRLPDRNFDGFFSGLSAWFTWLLMGVTVAFLPYVAFRLFGGDHSTNRVLAFGLLALGFPYALMALMMSFLHDHALAAKPSGVLGALQRVFPSFLGICVVIVTALGAANGVFALASLLYENHFWLYVFACLASWTCALGIMIAVMRIAGLYYYRHKDVLRWHRDVPRWGVTWKL
jgi:hypothetical protein